MRGCESLLDFPVDVGARHDFAVVPTFDKGAPPESGEMLIKLLLQPFIAVSIREDNPNANRAAAGTASRALGQSGGSCCPSSDKYGPIQAQVQGIS
jgi:hypothetical protein